jgi:hypothetical protein
MPHIGGSDFAGTVEAVGPGAESVPVGKRVVVDPSLRFDWYDGLTAALVAGCMSDPAGADDSRLVGASLSELKGAKAAVAWDGKLYVANRDSSATGIAVVDLADGRITAFHASSLPPNDVALAGDSVLVVTGSDFATGALSRLNLKTGAWTPEYLTVGSDNALSAAGDQRKECAPGVQRAARVAEGRASGKHEGEVHKPAPGGRGLPFGVDLRVARALRARAAGHPLTSRGSA